MSLLIIPARALLRFSTAELWEKLEGDFCLRMDDGDIITNEKETLYSSYTWDYHRAYPETPLLKKHHLQTVLGGKRLSANSHLLLINNGLWNVYDAYKMQSTDKRVLIDVLSRMSYEITNTMYNELTHRLEAYVTSLDILDFLQIKAHPRVMQAYENLESSEAGIARITSEIASTMVDDPLLANNALVKTIQSGLVRQAQALQCLGPRGYLTDIDSNLFLTPVKRGFVQGIRDLYESMVESRTASMSLINSTEPLQQSEYFSRRQQLICQNVQNLHPGDCGSENYLVWPVRDVRYDGKTKIADCDLKTIAGKYYLDELVGELKIVKETDRHLIDTTIKMRSVVAGCHHPDPYGLCEVCFGQTSEAVPIGSNIGHITCVSMTSDLGQNILSTKHFIGSSVIEGIVLRPLEKRYLSAEINGNIYYLNTALKNKSVRFMIASSQALGLADLDNVSDVECLSISRVSEFDNVAIIVSDDNGEDTVPLTISVQGRRASMSHQLLKHIKATGWNVSKENNYVIDMAGWDYSCPLFILPMRHFNMSDHQSKKVTVMFCHIVTMLPTAEMR